MEGFNAVDYINELVAVGVSDEQAKVQAKAFGKALDANIATKKDIEFLRSETKKDIEILRGEFKLKIAEAKSDLIKWMCGIGLTLLISQTGLAFAVVRMLSK